MAVRNDVTLQVTLSASDLRLARQNLPHLLRQLGPQVGEVLFTVDRAKNERQAAATEEDRQAVKRLAEGLAREDPKIRVMDVDYSRDPYEDIRAMFFAGRDFPTHDYRDKAIYAYLFGLYAARNEYVFHLDADMLIGGGSQTWIDEACGILSSRGDVVICCPLPGPPTADRRLRSQSAELEPIEPLAYRFHHMSTRLYMVNRQEFVQKLGGLKPGFVRLRPMAKAILFGRMPYEPIEDMLSRAMLKRGQLRIDFQSKSGAEGLWALHPLNHSEQYYQLLPEIIRRVEAGEIPDTLRGESDLTEPLLNDWLGSGSPATG